MRRFALICSALALTLIPVSAAGAQDGGIAESIIFAGPGVHLLDEMQLQVTISGAVAVEYHGSAAAGCERVGLCEVSGTTTWDPGRSGILQLEKFVHHGKRRVGGFLLTRDSRTAAKVIRSVPGAPAAVCGDAKEGTGGLASVSSHSLAALSFRLVETRGADFLASHCAGPLSEDLAKLLPVRPLTRSVLDGKSTKVIDLSTTRPFSTGGFAGTLRSTVVLRVGPKVRRSREYEQAFKDIEASLKKYRKTYRELEARYEIKQFGGSLGVAFHGTSDPGLCADLDSCGASGTTVFQPQASGGELELDAYVPKRRPWSDLRTTFGLAPGHRARVTRITGYGEWRSASGNLTSTVAHADGGATCHDSVPVRGGSLYMAVQGGKLIVNYNLATGFGLTPQTRCPGPLLGELPLFQRLAQGSVPLHVLKKRSVTVHLKLSRAGFGIAGYQGTTDQDLTIQLRRVGVRFRTATLLY